LNPKQDLKLAVLSALPEKISANLFSSGLFLSTQRMEGFKFCLAGTNSALPIGNPFE
jgi:hypothetical protein